MYPKKALPDRLVIGLSLTTLCLYFAKIKHGFDKNNIKMRKKFLYFQFLQSFILTFCSVNETLTFEIKALFISIIIQWIK